MSEPSVRPPIFAQQGWYENDPRVLREELNQFLGDVSDPPVEGRLIGLIVPHPGLRYGGSTAAHAYKQLEGRHYDRVVLLGPQHRGDDGSRRYPIAVNTSDYYQTPLGKVPLDLEALRGLAGRIGIDFLSHDQEHSLEIQLPFLQRELGDFKLMPLMLAAPFYIYGQQVRQVCAALSAALLPIVDDRTLLVASSDLSHLPDYQEVQRFDRGLETLLRDFDIEGLIDYMVDDGVCRACGDVAIITLLLAARATGGNRVKILYRTNSQDVAGQDRWAPYIVGYMAAAIYHTDN